MSKSLDDVMKTLPRKRRTKIKRRGEAILDEYRNATVQFPDHDPITISSIGQNNTKEDE